MSHALKLCAIAAAVLVLFATPSMAAEGNGTWFSGAIGAGIVILGAGIGMGKLGACSCRKHGASTGEGRRTFSGAMIDRCRACSKVQHCFGFDCLYRCVVANSSLLCRFDRNDVNSSFPYLRPVWRCDCEMSISRTKLASFARGVCLRCSGCVHTESPCT